MGLPTSITLNIGSPAADVVFTQVSETGSKATYVAPSPQGDLQGRPTLEVSHQTTKAGIMRSMSKFTFPRYNATTLKYDGEYVSYNVTSRPTTGAVQGAKNAIEACAEFLDATNRATIAEGLV